MKQQTIMSAMDQVQLQMALPNMKIQTLGKEQRSQSQNKWKKLKLVHTRNTIPPQKKKK